MKIDGKGSGPKTTERIPAPQAPDAGETRRPTASLRPTDRVEISALGRARHEELEDASAVRPVPAHQTDRLEQVRQRVQSGFYESDDVQRAVARLIVARGDHRSH